MTNPPRHVAALTALAVPLAATVAYAAVGDLTRKPGTAGCISDTGTAGACQDGVGLTFIADVTVSPDGRSVYGASEYDEAVSVFDRNPTTGELTQKPGRAGCISDTGDPATAVSARTGWRS